MSEHDSPSRAATVAAFAAFLTLGVVVATYGPSIPHIETRFGIGASLAGLIVTAQFLGECAGIAAFGLTHARWTVRQRFAVAMPLFSAGLLVAAAAPAFALVLVALFVAGFGAGGVVILVNYSFATSYGRRSPAMLGLVNASWGAGSFIGPALVGAAAGYPQVLAGAGIAGLLCIAPLLGMPNGAPPLAVAPVAASSMRGLILAFAVLLFVYTGIETGVGTWEATDLVGSGWTVQGAALATSLYWGAFTIGRILGAPLAVRVAPERLLLPALFVATLVLLGIRAGLISPLSFTVVGLCAGPVFPVVLSWLTRVLPNAASAMTYLILGAILGSAVLPAVLGGLIGLSGLQVMPLGVAAYAVACFTMVTFVAVWRRRAEAVSPRPE